MEVPTFMYIILAIAVIVSLFLGMLFGSRLYYNMRVRKEIERRVKDLTAQIEETKWYLEQTKVGTQPRLDLMAKYHLQKGQRDELNWVLSYGDYPEGQ